MTRRKRRLPALAIALAAAALPCLPAAAQIDEDEARAVHARRCQPDRPAVPGTPSDVERMTFFTDAAGPALLVLCEDREAMALEIPIDTINLALVFMAYRPLAPFWPAAEARWGKDLAILREEVRAAPVDALVESDPHLPVLGRRLTGVFAQFTVAYETGDFDRARQLLESELDRIVRWRKRKPGSTRYDFELSVILPKLAALVAEREGPSAGADRLAALVAEHPVEAAFRPNIDLSHAGFLVEAGRLDEAIALAAPYVSGKGADRPASRKADAVDQAPRFAWVMACALHRKGDAAAAAPHIAQVEAGSADYFYGGDLAERSRLGMRLGMYACMGDTERFLAAFAKQRPWYLAREWLVFQDGTRPIMGRTMPKGLIESPGARVLAADYRQLPESYRAALSGWRDAGGAD